MTILLLTTWAATGLAMSAVLSPRKEDRGALAPLAAILGPLWLPVVLERREVARRHGTIEGPSRVAQPSTSEAAPWPITSVSFLVEAPVPETSGPGRGVPVVAGR